MESTNFVCLPVTQRREQGITEFSRHLPVGDLKLYHSIQKNPVPLLTPAAVEKYQGRIRTVKIFKNQPGVIQEIIPGLS